MPKYNPNSIWGSQKKEYAYDPDRSLTPTRPQEKAAEKSPGKNAETKSAGPEERLTGPGLKPANQQFTGPRGASMAGKPPMSSTPKYGPNGSGGSGSGRVKNPWLWWLSGGVAVIFASLIYIFFIVQSGSGPSIGLQFSKPDQVPVGDPFTLTISYLNTSNNILKNAVLSVQLPDSVSFVGQGQGQRVMEQQLGDLGPNSLNKQDFTLVVTGNPASIQHITASASYGANSRTQYQSTGGVDIRVGDPAVALTFTAPNNIFSGQDFDTTVTYQNNSSKEINNATLQLQYPPSFTFKKSSVAPLVAGGSAWNLGTLAPGASGNITVTGNIIGPEQARYVLGGSITASVSGQNYPVNAQSANYVISSSPLSIAIALNNTQDYVAKLSDTLNYMLTYTNNSDVTFQGITIKAVLIGAMFDLSSVHSDASFDSRSNTLTWYGANTPALRSLAPRESGSVTVQLSTKGAYPIRLLSDKNYSLKVNAEISSPTVPSNTAGSGTMSVSSLENKVGGKIAITSKGYWHDQGSGFIDSGPYPPKMNQSTQYAIHWRVTNYATDAQNVTVSAYLQSGTTYTGQVKSNVSSTPTYDAATGLVTWTVLSIPATKGLISAPAELIFQVSNTPAVNQVGSVVTLLGATTLQASDVFTGAALQAASDAVTTDLPDDPNIAIPLGNRRVTQ